MSEQLVMLVSDGKLEARGPRWQWEKLTKTHWVAYPDKLIAVTDMEDDHLRRTMIYLAGWSARTVFRRGFFWEMRHGGDEGYGPFETPSARELMERLVPCLTALEAEAQRRGLEVPKVPGFECPVEKVRAEKLAVWKAEDEARNAQPCSPIVEAPRRRPLLNKVPRHCRSCGKKGHDARTCPKGPR